MKRRVDKHTSYFELLESLQATRTCALCDLRKRGTARYLESLLYESVNDPGLRRKLAESRGFCRRHAESLLDCRDGLGTAILYQDQVEGVLEFLAEIQKKNGKATAKRAAGEWERHARCQACQEEERMDATRIGILIKGLAEPEMRRVFEGSAGLCIPHLLESLKQAGDTEKQRFLLELHQKKFEQLLDDLKEFVRKHDYRYAHEEYGAESDVWLRAPKMILGDR